MVEGASEELCIMSFMCGWISGGLTDHAYCEFNINIVISFVQSLSLFSYTPASVIQGEGGHTGKAKRRCFLQRNVMVWLHPVKGTALFSWAPFPSICLPNKREQNNHKRELSCLWEVPFGKRFSVLYSFVATERGISHTFMLFLIYDLTLHCGLRE